MKAIILSLIVFVLTPILVLAEVEVVSETASTTEEVSSPPEQEIIATTTDEVIFSDSVEDAIEEVIDPETEIETDEPEYISGELTEDQTWTKAESPYYVDWLYIPAGVTLTIEAGAHILVGDSIVVDGRMVIKGTDSDHVVFDLLEDYYLRDIYVSSAGSVDLSYTDIYKSGGVLVDGGELVADHLVMSGGSEDRREALLVTNGGRMHVSHSLIESNPGRRGSIVGSYENSYLTISDTEIIPTSGAAVSILGGETELNNLKTSGGSQEGVEIFTYYDWEIDKYLSSKVKIVNSTITNFAKQGVFAIDPDLTIESSTITGNSVGIESYARSNFNVLIRDSTIVDNDTGAIFFMQNRDADAVFDVANNWWGDPTGPYESERNPEGLGNMIDTYYGDSIDFLIYEPWLTAPPGTKKRNPVIIIPGIMGSYLNHDDEDQTEVWVNILKALLPGDDNYLDDLILPTTGKPNNNNDIFSIDVIRKISNNDFFNNLISTLIANGYEEGKDIFVFPYDWRFDVEDNVNGTLNSKVQSLKDKIGEIKTNTGSDQVDIVAHSMGGLLAKYYIKTDSDDIAKFIDVATPHLGAPKALKALVYGDNMGIQKWMLGLNPEEVKEISQNMPSVYNLLPSANYFSTTTADYKYYLFDGADADGDGVIGRLDFLQTTEFLYGTGRNSTLLQNASNLHDGLDNFNPNDYEVDTYNIVGCGTPTIGKIFTQASKNPKDPHYSIQYINGDGTVPQRSAEYLATDNLYYAHGIEHATMPSNDGVSNLVVSILSNDTDNFDYGINRNIARNTVNCELPNGKYIEVHSPVDLHIYDSEGNHVGPDDNGDIEYGISGVVYDVIDGNKFAFIPDGDDYEVKLSATDNGTFSAHIKTSEQGEIVSTAYFEDVSLAGVQTRAEILPSDPVILLDSDGSGNFRRIGPSYVKEGDTAEEMGVSKVESASAVIETSSRSYGGGSSGWGLVLGTSTLDTVASTTVSAITEVQVQIKPKDNKVVSQAELESATLQAGTKVNNLALVSNTSLFSKLFNLVYNFLLAFIIKIF